MSIDRLVFVGFNGRAVALDRNTGEVVWCNADMHRGYVSLLLEGERLIVSSDGYMYCLDANTGHKIWENPLRGYGQGPASLVSVHGCSSSALIQQAAAQSASQSNSAAVTT